MSRKYILTNTVKDDHIMTVITGFLIQRTTNKKIRKKHISLIGGAPFTTGRGYRRGVQLKGGGGGEGGLAGLRGHGHGLAERERLAGGHHGGHVGYAKVSARCRHSKTEEIIHKSYQHH